MIVVYRRLADESVLLVYAELLRSMVVQAFSVHGDHDQGQKVSVAVRETGRRTKADGILRSLSL